MAGRSRASRRRRRRRRTWATSGSDPTSKWPPREMSIGRRRSAEWAVRPRGHLLTHPGGRSAPVCMSALKGVQTKGRQVAVCAGCASHLLNGPRGLGWPRLGLGLMMSSAVEVQVRRRGQKLIWPARFAPTTAKTFTSPAPARRLLTWALNRNGPEPAGRPAGDDLFINNNLSPRAATSPWPGESQQVALHLHASAKSRAKVKSPSGSHNDEADEPATCCLSHACYQN